MRIQPALPAAAMKTYQVLMPLATHWRAATCTEIGCVNWANGWETRVPAGSELADEVRSLKGRWHFTETRDGGDAVFTFPPGQDCFQASSHRVNLQRPQVYVERGGDWRGNPRGNRYVHTAGTWQDSFANHQDQLATRMERG